MTGEAKVRPRIVIIGAGPAGLMAATQLRHSQAEIILVDQKSAPGRKFLVAGHGGFNLTHSEPLESFVKKYDDPFIRDCVRAFSPDDTRKWLQEIGIETVVGSSGKVFPMDHVKPIEVLNAWLQFLDLPESSLKFETTFVDFDGTDVEVIADEKSEKIPYDYLIFATGGASWKKTGSDGKWTVPLAEHKVTLKPFAASNSGLEIVKDRWIEKYEGAILKNVRVSFGDLEVPGDLTVTHYGIEGKPAYASNNWLRNHDLKGLRIDFKPQFSLEQIRAVVERSKTIRDAFRDLKLSGAVYLWFREELTKEEFTDPETMSRLLKAFEPEIKGFRPIDEVISTVGGVAMSEIDETGKLKAFENVYCCGEMLGWDAPTGGYLLQACFSTGFVVGRSLKLKMEN